MDEKDNSLSVDFLHYYFTSIFELTKTPYNEAKVKYPNEVELPTQKFIQFYFNNKKFKNDSFDKKTIRAIKDVYLHGFLECDKMKLNEFESFEYFEKHILEKFYEISNTIKKNYEDI